jgi:hypothetical protein
LGVAPDGIGSYNGVKKTKLRHIGKREMGSMAFVKLDGLSYADCKNVSTFNTWS